MSLFLASDPPTPEQEAALWGAGLDGFKNCSHVQPLHASPFLPVASAPVKVPSVGLAWGQELLLLPTSVGSAVTAS